MQLAAEDIETFRLLYVHLFLNDPIEKHSLHIRLMNFPTHLHWESKDGPYGRILCGGCKGFLIINPVDLWEAPGHKSSLVFLNTPISRLFYLIDPSWTFHWFTNRPWNNLPSTISDNGFILLHHYIYPCGLLYCFLKIRWLCRNTFAHEIHVSSESVRRLSLPTLWSRNSYILCRIKLQPLSFYGMPSASYDVWLYVSGLLHSMKLLCNIPFSGISTISPMRMLY